MTAVQCVDLPVLPYGKSDEFRVLRYSITLKGLLIPRGFLWDGASIPAAAQPLVGKPWECQYQRASLLHDYLYVTHKADRRWADDRLYDMMRVDGAGVTTAYTVWLACRLFGGSRWDAKGRHKFLPEAQVRSIERALNFR